MNNLHLKAELSLLRDKMFHRYGLINNPDIRMDDSITENGNINWTPIEGDFVLDNIDAWMIKNVIITVNPDIYRYFGFEQVEKTFRHEMAHLINIEENGSGHHDKSFKDICAKVGGSMNSDHAGRFWKKWSTDQFVATAKKKRLPLLPKRYPEEGLPELIVKIVYATCIKPSVVEVCIYNWGRGEPDAGHCVHELGITQDQQNEIYDFYAEFAGLPTTEEWAKTVSKPSSS